MIEYQGEIVLADSSNSIENDYSVAAPYSVAATPEIRPIEERLISILEEQGPLKRSQLVGIMDVPRTTIYDGLKRLIQQGAVKKYPLRDENTGRGRPPVFFEKTC